MDGKDGWKDVQHVHDGFDQHDEHGEDGNNDVVICYTVARISNDQRPWQLGNSVQLRPDFRSSIGSVVCSCVQSGERTGVEAIVCTILPQFGAICVWRSNTE